MISITLGKGNTIINYQEGWQGILESQQCTIGSLLEKISMENTEVFFPPNFLPKKNYHKT